MESNDRLDYLIALERYEKIYKKFVLVRNKVIVNKKNKKILIKEKYLTEKKIRQIQDMGLLVGEIIKKIAINKFVIKAPAGTLYLVSSRKSIKKKKKKENNRIAMDTSTLCIMKIIRKKTDPFINTMLEENPGTVLYFEIGGLEKQLIQLREIVELPLYNKEIFHQIGIKIPKGILLHGPPGTGKTLLAKAVAFNVRAKFLKIAASGIVDKYIGESARIIREIFQFAKKNKPCIIFIDEVDAIGGKRFSDGTSADREIQRTLMELLNQLDGYEELSDIKTIMATNRPDVLDPALLRPGRIDRKILIPLPDSRGKQEILKIHLSKIKVKGDVDFEKIISLCKNFNGADIRNVCTEAGLFALRKGRIFIKEDDLKIAAEKILISKDMNNIGF